MSEKENTFTGIKNLKIHLSSFEHQPKVSAVSVAVSVAISVAIHVVAIIIMALSAVSAAITTAIAISSSGA